MNLIKTGIVLLFIGFVMVLAWALLSSQKANVGGLIMIGPIPIAFGTSAEITVLAMVIGLIILILMFFFGSSWHVKEAPDEKSIPAGNLSEESGRKIEGGGVILIGPIPVVFGTDKRYAIIAIILTIALMVLAIIFLNIL